MRYHDLLGVLLLVVLLLTSPSLAVDPGVGWHLKTGEWILANDYVPAHDPFLASGESAPWICNQWLADLGMALGYQYAGFALLFAVLFLVVILPFAGVLPFAINKVSAPIAFAVLFLAALGASIQWHLRPVILSFLLFALVYTLLIRRRYLYIPIIFALWANVHPAFPLGVLLIGLATLDGMVERDLRPLATLLLSVLATLLTPYGVELWKGIAGLIGDQYFMRLNNEWKPPNLFQSYTLSVPVLFTMALVTIPLRSPRRFLEEGALIIFFILATTAVRYIPFFALAAVVPAARGLQGAVERWGMPEKSYLTTLLRRPPKSILLPPFFLLLSAALIGYAAFTGGLPGWSSKRLDFGSYAPQSLVDYLVEAKLYGNLFHTPNWGGYITFRLFPTHRAFIDDRNEVNGEERYEEFFTVNRVRDGWRAVLDRHRIRYLLLEPASPALKELRLRPEFKVVFESNEGAILEYSRG